VKLWNIQNGRFIRTVSGERNQIVALAMSPDGRVMATGSIGRDIDLMAYPLKVRIARKGEPSAAPSDEATAEAPGTPESPTDSGTSGGGMERDLNALTALEEEKEKGPTAVRDTLQELDKLEARLNELLRTGHYCQSAPELEHTAFHILDLAAYDQAAYHALVISGIVRQDLKLIYLMSRIGGRADFLTAIYTYDLPQSVHAKLDFWQDVIFNPALRRTGRELVLEFVDCSGKSQVRTMPAELLALDIPSEALHTLASRRVHVDFSQFRGLDAQTFLQRVYYLIDVATRLRKPAGGKDEPIEVAFKDVPAVKFGVLPIDLAELDLFGYPDKVPFRLRRERGRWMSYVTDGDRKKKLLVPEGNYYLMVDKRVRNVFSITESSTAPLADR
jgi:hypothetical protein